MKVDLLLDLPHGKANSILKQLNKWDYDYPQWFFDQLERVLNISLNEDQRRELIVVYEEAFEGYGCAICGEST